MPIALLVVLAVRLSRGRVTVNVTTITTIVGAIGTAATVAAAMHPRCTARIARALIRRNKTDGICEFVVVQCALITLHKQVCEDVPVINCLDQMVPGLLFSNERSMFYFRMRGLAMLTIAA